MPNESFDPSKQFLPSGYYVRLLVMLALTVGGVVCMIFYNELLGVAMSLGAPVFAKLSGFREMHQKYKAALHAYEAANPRRNQDRIERP